MTHRALRTMARKTNALLYSAAAAATLCAALALPTAAEHTGGSGGHDRVEWSHFLVTPEIWQCFCQLYTEYHRIPAHMRPSFEEFVVRVGGIGDQFPRTAVFLYLYELTVAGRIAV